MMRLFKTPLLFVFISGILLWNMKVTFAAGSVSLFMGNWVKFNSNDPSQELPVITVTDNSGGTITAANGITIILPKYTEIIWDKTVSQIKVNDVLTSVSYNKTLKNLTVPVSKTFIAGEAVTISGQKVRIYERGAVYQNLALDVTGDGIAEVDGTNGIQLDDATRRSDLLAPYAVTGLTVNQTAQSVILSWENPPDPDFNGLFLTRALTRGSSTAAVDMVLTSATSVYTDSDIKPGDKLVYTFKAKDYIGNLSEAITTTVNIPSESIVNETAVGSVGGNDVGVGSSTQDVAKNVLNANIDADIAMVLDKYLDLNDKSQNLKLIVNLVKKDVLSGRGGKLNLSQKMTYATFATAAGKVFEVHKKGSYYSTFKKLGYFPKNAKTSKKISRKNALRILLMVKNGTPTTDPILLDGLNGFATKEDFVNWMATYFPNFQ